MWNPNKIQAMLASAGLPASCGSFPDRETAKSPVPPFILWAFRSHDLYADDSNYSPFADMTVELYTRGREFSTENRLEALFRENGLPWEKYTDYMAEQRLHVATYEMTLPMEMT